MGSKRGTQRRKRRKMSIAMKKVWQRKLAGKQNYKIPADVNVIRSIHNYCISQTQEDTLYKDLNNFSVIVYQPCTVTTSQPKNNSVEVICRTCLNDCEPDVDIFNYRKNNILLADMLINCISLEIQKEDGFPVNICKDCMQKLTSSFDFKTMVIESNTRLHESYQRKENKIEEGLSENDTGSILINEENFIKFQQSATKLRELHQAARIKTEEELCSNTLGDALDNDENFIKVEPSTVTDFRCETEDSLENRPDNEERDVKIKLELESSDENDGFFDDSTGTSWNLEDPLRTEKCDEIKRITPVSDILGKKYAYELHTVQNQTSNEELNIKVQLQFQSDGKGGSLSDPDETRLSSEDPSELEKREKITQTAAVANEKKKEEKVGNCNQKHAELLDNPDYKRIINSGLNNKQRSRETVFCGECRKTFTFRYYVGRHAFMHTGKVPFKCDKCERRFPKEFLLNQHMRLHVKSRDFACTMCSQSFFNKQHLQSHEALKHSEERPYKCDVCGLTFKISSGLAQHARSHVKDKQYICETCGKTFVEMARLSKHKRNHDAEKNFVCTICNKGFVSLGILNWHMKAHLKKNP